MFIIDIILVAVFALIIFISAKRGFVLTVFDLVSGMLACLLAKLVAPPVAQLVYDNALKDTVLEFLSQQFANIEDAAVNYFSDPSSMLGFLPENIVGFIENSGLLDFSNLSETISENIISVEQLESNIVGPVVLSVVNLICFGIFALIFLIALRIVGLIISKLVKTTKFGEKLNMILGAVCGVLKGVLYTFVIAVIIVVLALFSEPVAEYASASYICKFAGSLIGL